MRIGLIPLDERPVNVRYPLMLAAIAGVELALPPLDVLSQLRRPAPWEELRAWVQETAPSLDALIVSCEMLGYGGLIASRIGDEPLGKILQRLEAIRELKKLHPHLLIHGFNVITRISNADDSFEEPDYWAEYGTRLHLYSKLAGQTEADPSLAEARDHVRQEIPEAVRHDFTTRRMRNHAVNLAILQMVADGLFDLLVLSSDDTSALGFATSEKSWLEAWVAQLEIADRVLMYPGADEVGGVLLMRIVNASNDYTPQFFPYYLEAEGARTIAAYEDVAIQTTFERQVQAVGGRITEGPDGFFVAINTPVAGQQEWSQEFQLRDAEERGAATEEMLEQVQRQLSGGGKALVVDVAYPNGAEPNLFGKLNEQISLPQLTSYSGWNTAGNSIGTALAHAAASAFVASPLQERAHARFMLHRLLEDWGYQRIVRAEARRYMLESFGHAEPAPAEVSQLCRWIESRLQQLLEKLPGYAGRYRIVSGSVRLPWGRTFEVDFELTETDE